MLLTDIIIRSAQPAAKPIKFCDAEGLYLEVSPRGGKWWRRKYRFAGKERRFSLGTSPQVSLKVARIRGEAAKIQLANGVDQSAARQASKRRQGINAENRFESVAREWREQWKDARNPSHTERVLRRLETNLFPPLGKMSINDITAPELVAAVKKIEAQGAHEIAKRALQTAGQIFRYAIVNGKTERNPAADIKPADALKPRVKRNFARVSEKELPELLRKIDGYDGTPVTRLALHLMALTFVRTTELIGARWEEFEIKGNRGTWRIPPQRMKMKDPHIVPLTHQTIAILEQLREFTGNGELLFPGDRNPRKPISNNTLLFAIYQMGYHSRMTGHGFRGVASTILHEQGYEHEHIELQLAHQDRDEVSAAYNYAKYLVPRAKMMQEWANYLDAAKKK